MHAHPALAVQTLKAVELREDSLKHNSSLSNVLFTGHFSHALWEQREKKEKRKKETFMAAFVCEVLLDLALCIWAELHFANYFPVAEFSAWRSSPALRREAQQ